MIQRSWKGSCSRLCWNLLIPSALQKYLKSERCREVIKDWADNTGKLRSLPHDFPLGQTALSVIAPTTLKTASQAAFTIVLRFLIWLECSFEAVLKQADETSNCSSSGKPIAKQDKWNRWKDLLPCTAYPLSVRSPSNGSDADYWQWFWGQQSRWVGGLFLLYYLNGWRLPSLSLQISLN